MRRTGRLNSTGKHLHALISAAMWSSIALNAQDVNYHWCGGLGSHVIRVNVWLSAPCPDLRLLVDDDSTFATPLRSPPVAVDLGTGLVAALKMSGLQPSTQYWYAFEVEGEPALNAADIGTFRTPAEGAFSFSFTAGSCNTNSDHPVFEAMRQMNPLFFLSTGDLHYADPTDTLPGPHRDAYAERVLDRQPAAAFLHRTPIVYIWDDHDFCGNGSNAASPGRAAARTAYGQSVPHYPLADPGIDAPIDQAFTIGRVHFILSDLRSTKTDTTMMDEAQRVWLRDQLLFARDHHLMAVWISSLTWNSNGYPENWGSCPQEREALGDWLRDHGIANMCILSGDAHMLAIDSGANADFSADQNSPYRYPIFQAAALNRSGSYKGGFFDQGGYFPNPSYVYGQFGRVTVTDDGGPDLCITFEGYRTDSLGSGLTVINELTFCRTLDSALAVDGSPSLPDLMTVSLTGEGLQIVGAPTGEPMQLQIVDPEGRIVLRYDLVSYGSAQVVPLTQLNAGAYVAVVRSGARSAIRRFVIL